MRHALPRVPCTLADSMRLFRTRGTRLRRPGSPTDGRATRRPTGSLPDFLTLQGDARRSLARTPNVPGTPLNRPTTVPGIKDPLRAPGLEDDVMLMRVFVRTAADATLPKLELMQGALGSNCEISRPTTDVLIPVRPMGLPR